MKVSFEWLKEYVNITVSPAVLAEKLTMAGLEVGSVEAVGGTHVFDMEITANRPDCLSVLGIAQEVAAVLDKKLTVKTPSISVRPSKPLLPKAFIKLQDKKGCPYYRGCLCRGVKVGPSPQWLQQRLEAVGIRTINNIVDITNYCLLEYGQPLHAFDYDLLSKNIIVRRARSSEKMVLIDGVERTLTNDMLVIADARGPVALAGVMGGQTSEVSDKTTTVFLESAYFDPTSIRHTARTTGVTTESSYRFERGVDRANVMHAQNKALVLLRDIAGGTCVDMQSAGQGPVQRRVIIDINVEEINSLLSTSLTSAQMKRTLRRLGCEVRSHKKNELAVVMPYIRRDVRCQEDVAEEIARIYGYEKISETMPAIRSRAINNDCIEMMKPAARRIATALGFQEAITHSLISQRMLESVGVSNARRLSNALSSEQEFLRPTLLPSLLESLARNIRHNNKSVRLFEISHVFGANKEETRDIAFMATGPLFNNWQIQQSFDAYWLKGSIETFLTRLGYDQIAYTEIDASGIFEAGSTLAICVQSQSIGILGQVRTDALQAYDCKTGEPVWYAALHLDTLQKVTKNERGFVPLPAFPALTRDMSVLVKESVSYEALHAVVLRAVGNAYHCSIRLSDIYTGKQIPAGHKSLTLALTFRRDDRTLTDEEIVGVYNALVQQLHVEYGATIR